MIPTDYALYEQLGLDYEIRLIAILLNNCLETLEPFICIVHFET